MCCKFEGEWNPIERAARGCTRDDLPPVEWDVSPDRLSHYLGRPGRDYPIEDIEDGCPGGWRSAPLLRSVLGLVRKRTKDGGRVQNPFFDRIEDDVILTAVLAYEAHEDANRAHFEECWAEEQRRAKR